MVWALGPLLHLVRGEPGHHKGGAPVKRSTNSLMPLQGNA